jgi:ABC-type nitrate/sulfonate/bicarbonate transport system permease component
MTRALHTARRVAAVLGLPIALILLWWLLTTLRSNFLMPPLPRILEVFPETWLWDRMGHDVVPSLVRLAEGYVVSLVLGLAAGVAIGSSRRLRSLAEPTLEFLRAIPPPALIPILFLLAGIGDTTKILVIVSGCVWPVLLNTVEGVRGVDPVQVDTCRSYRIDGILRLRAFVLRSASPQIITGARQSLSIAIILMVISELKASTEGLGYSIEQFQTGFQYPQMWSAVILLGLIGVLLSLIFRVAENRVLRWYHGMRAVERASR